MSKQTGMGAALWVGGVDLSGDTGGLSRINNARGVLPSTGIDKSAMERLHGLRDGGLEWQSWFNPAASQAHATLKAVPSTDRNIAYCHRTTLGAVAAATLAKQISYDPSRGEDGSFTIGVVAESTGYGVEWGQLLTAGKRIDTGATNGTGVDLGTGSTAFGLQAYLHVFAFTGTDITIRLQESSDNAVGDAYANITGGAFTAVTSGTAPQAQRIETSRTQTVERWLRVVTTTSAGFTSCTFGVIVKRNLVSTVF